MTPGHPEVHHTTGVEITTGPLGSGLASAVGMACAQRRQRGLFDPDAKPGQSPFDHHIYVLASDGDIMEGVSSRGLLARRPPGARQPHADLRRQPDLDRGRHRHLVLRGRRQALRGLRLARRDGRLARRRGDGGAYVEDVDALLAAIERGKQVTDKPTLVVLHTIIAWPAPTKQNTGKSHGSALGDDEIAATKKLLGFDPEQTFEVDDDVLAHAREVVDRGKAAARASGRSATTLARGQPRARRAARPRRVPASCPRAWTRRCRSSPPTPRASPPAPRPARSSPRSPTSCPSCGAARPTSPSPTTRRWTASSRLRPRATARPREWKGGPYGRTLHFGIREHAMGMILNGIALEGLTRPYGGTFLVFSDYMRPSVRLAAIQQLPVTYVWTHDSIGLGEDGPTHQPIEHLAALRAIPGLDVVRPGDANETAVAWRTILGHSDRPAGLALTRQALPVLDRETFASAERRRQGRLRPHRRRRRQPRRSSSSPPAPRSASPWPPASTLEAQGVSTRVVSMPCREWFAAQDQSYRDEVLPPALKARVEHRGRRPRSAGATSSATPAASSASTTTAPPPTTRPCTASSGSRPRRSWQRPTNPSRQQEATA